MPLPATRTVTGTYTNPVTGAAATGTVTLTPVPKAWTDTDGQQLLAGGGEITLVAGAFSQTLVTTDADGVEPATGKLWRIEEELTGLPTRVRYFALPVGDGTPIDITAIVAADPGAVGYTPIEGPTRGGVTLATDGAPTSALGIEGDWALDTGARRLYGPREASAWPTFSVVPAPTEPGWVRNGFAELLEDDLYLTEAGDGFGAGSSWYSTLVTTDGLDVTFEGEMSGGTGADGICLAFADPATASSFLGAGGGDLGLVGCDSVALALDTGAGSRARLVQTTASAMTALATYGGSLTLRPAPFTARLRYLSGVLTAWVNDVQILQHTIALPATARLGFTGSNGGLVDDHIVRNVSVVPRGGILL